MGGAIDPFAQGDRNNEWLVSSFLEVFFFLDHYGHTEEKIKNISGNGEFFGLLGDKNVQKSEFFGMRANGRGG